MRFLIFGAAVTFPVLRADEPMQVKWDEMCKVAAGKEIDIRTTVGDNVKGFCVGINVDEVSVRTTDGKVVKLARTALGKIRLHRVRSGQLKALGNGMRGGLEGSVGMLFSPLAPLGIVGVPGTIAWGAVAAPFCALSDLHDKLHGTREIRLK